MTRANSLHVREAGRPINVPVTRQRGPTPTRALPHGRRPYDCRARPRRQNSAQLNRCRDPASQSIAGSHASRTRSISSRPPSTRARRAWTPHTLRGSIEVDVVMTSMFMRANSKCAHQVRPPPSVNRSGSWNGGGLQETVSMRLKSPSSRPYQRVCQNGDDGGRLRSARTPKHLRPGVGNRDRKSVV